MQEVAGLSKSLKLGIPEPEAQVREYIYILLSGPQGVILIHFNLLVTTSSRPWKVRFVPLFGRTPYLSPDGV